jgi:D-alanyl-D-alanine carboxypeptidase
MRKALKIIGIIFGVLVLIVGIGFGYLYYKSRPESLAKFIRDNPSRSSIYYIHNGTVGATVNPDKVMPLASTVKILVAIEYARQAAAGIVDSAEAVDTMELEKYYLPGTDGNAHVEWKKSMHKKGLISGGRVKIEEVAKGMIRFSSNANTEYLLDRLGLDSVNAGIERLGLKNQQPLYPIVSALFVGNGGTLQQLKDMPLAQYIAETKQIHERLKNDTGYKRKLKDLPMGVQRVWSDRLPGGTTREYAGILQKINGRHFFSENEQKHIDNVMEGILENPENRAWLEHAGFKGGSTAFVFTMAMYATTKKGDKTELAYFFNDLTMWEGVLLQSAANEFHLKLLTDKDATAKLLDIINGK